MVGVVVVTVVVVVVVVVDVAAALFSAREKDLGTRTGGEWRNGICWCSRSCVGCGNGGGGGLPEDRG